MEFFHKVIDTWSRLFSFLLESSERFIAEPLESTLELGAFLADSFVSLLFLCFFFSVFSGLYGTGASLIAKIRSHPAQYSDYKVGDTRKCVLLTVGSAVGAFATGVFHEAIFGSNKPQVEPYTLCEAVNDINESITALYDGIIILVSIMLLVGLLILLRRALSKPPAKASS